MAARENDDSMEVIMSEDTVSDLENSPKFVDSEELNSRPKRQFKTAEIADAVMGTETPIDPSDIESLFPKNVKDYLSGFSPLCNENGEQCGLPAVAEDGESQGESDAESQQVTLDIVRADSVGTEELNATETAKTFKVNCDRRNITGIDDFAVQVLNASQDLMEFLNANSTECSVVLFFTAWCQFSASLAPHFNALPRVFPSMHFLALDASQHSSSLSTRFGTVAVPNILLFQGAKPMARFNHTDRTLETLTSFISNQTGFEAGPDRNVTEADRLGPLPSVPVKGIDWLLVFSILFITGFTLYAILRTDSIRWLIPGQEHEHQD